MALDSLTVTLAVPEHIYEDLRPRYDRDGKHIENEDTEWNPEDDTLASLQHIIVETGEKLGLEILPLLRPAAKTEEDTTGIVLTSDLIFSYKPSSLFITELCKSAMGRLNHSIIFGHPEDVAPHISSPMRKLLESLNIPLDRLFLLPIGDRMLNRIQVQDTLKHAMEFAADPPLKYD